MRKHIVFLSLALLVSQTNFAYKIQELHLHFDINKTIVATDAVQNKDLAITVNEIIAQCTFEKWNGTELQSYYAFLTDLIAAEHPQLPRANKEFKQIRIERLKQFPDFLSNYPELLARYEKERTQILKILDHEEMAIFPSFYKAIRWLEAEFPGKYSIFLRTFGKDLPEVVPAIEENTAIRFAGHGKFQGAALLMTIDGKAHVNFFSLPPSTHCAIQDDHAHWASHEFQAIGGKRFPINPEVTSMFFDDNADDPDRQIICPVGPNEELINTEELLKSGHIVAVNSKEAILDEDYFINKIKSVLQQVSE